MVWRHPSETHHQGSPVDPRQTAFCLVRSHCIPAHRPLQGFEKDVQHAGAVAGDVARIGRLQLPLPRDAVAAHPRPVGGLHLHRPPGPAGVKPRQAVVCIAGHVQRHARRRHRAQEQVAAASPGVA